MSDIVVSFMYHEHDEHDECLYTMVMLQTDSLNKYSEIKIDTCILVYSVESCVLISLFYWNICACKDFPVYMVYLGFAWNWKLEKKPSSTCNCIHMLIISFIVSFDTLACCKYTNNINT